MKKTPILLIIALVGLLQACGGAKIPTNPCGVGEKRGKFRAANERIKPQISKRPAKPDKPIQAQVVTVLGVKGRTVKAIALSMNKKDTIYFNYLRGIGMNARMIMIGTWITIYAYQTDDTCKWYTRKIKINE